jgi:hypothetical protein
MSQSKYQNTTTEQIIADLNIANKMIDRHYEIETEALKTDDVNDESAVEFIAEMLAENDHDALEYNWYEAKANEIIDAIADDVAAEICDRDRDAMEYENERREAMKGNY